MANKVHELKTLPEFYEEIIKGYKNFEARKADRDYHCGDFLHLQEYHNGIYTGRSVMAQVTFILRGGNFGIEKDYCVMSIKTLQ